MDIIVLIGRILYGLIFVGSGIAGHLLATDATAGYAQMRGMKNPRVPTQISGALIAAGGLGVMFGVYADLAVLGLIAYLLITNVLIHHFWTDTDPMMKQMEMTQFMKNTSIAGGGLILFALLQSTDVAYMLTDPLF